jgi:hypothetical protein
MLKTPGAKRLKLKHDVPLSISGFEFELRRYTSVSLLEVIEAPHIISAGTPPPPSPPSPPPSPPPLPPPLPPRPPAPPTSPPKSAAVVAALQTPAGQGLTLVHFSAQLEPCLSPENTLHTLNTP